MNPWLRRLLQYAGVLFALYWVVLFIGTHIPQDAQVIPPIQRFDKFLHFAGFAGLAFLAAVALRIRRGETLGRQQYLLIILGLWAYAAFDELTQTLPMIRRHGDVMDWLADATGVLIGLTLYFALAAWFRRMGIRPNFRRAAASTTPPAENLVEVPLESTV